MKCVAFCIIARSNLTQLFIPVNWLLSPIRWEDEQGQTQHFRSPDPLFFSFFFLQQTQALPFSISPNSVSSRVNEFKVIAEALKLFLKSEIEEY